MANLEAELSRFLAARFGVDVKDSFVSCIRKIHDENITVAQLRDEMQAAADKLGVAEKELEAKLAKALQEYLAKYDAVRVVAETSAAAANRAEATATNAEFTAEEALDQITQAVLLVQQLDSKVNSLQLVTNEKIDGAYVENGYLWLTADGVEVVGPLGPFSGGGVVVPPATMQCCRFPTHPDGCPRPLLPGKRYRYRSTGNPWRMNCPPALVLSGCR